MTIDRHKTAAPSNEPDAELLRLNAEYRTLLGEINAGRHNDEKGDVSDEARNRMSGLEKKIADTPAESYAGIGIKLLIGVDNFCPLNPGETRTTDKLNLESALADAERLAGATSSTVAPETTGEDPFEALAKEWAAAKAESGRVWKAFNDACDTLPKWADGPYPKQRELRKKIRRARERAGVDELGKQCDLAVDKQNEIEKRISETPTTTLLGIVTKLRAEASMEVEYEFTTTENVIKTALAGAGYLLAQSQEADAELLALEAEIVNEYAAWKAGKIKDDEAEEHGERVSDMDQRFAEMPVHTLSGVAAKLRHLRRLLVDDGTLRTGDISLVETTLAAVEQGSKAERASARR